MPTAIKLRPAHPGNPTAAKGELEDPTASLSEVALVEAARQGDLAAFGQIYRRFFYQIYDFAVRVTRDVRRAEEITTETLARSVDELAVLTEPSELLGRLLAITHGLATAAPYTGKMPPGSVTGPDAEIETLIWDSAALLGPKTYAVIDLSVRQGLTDVEAGVVAGIRAEMAAESVARTRERADRAISVFVLVKTRVGACPGLRGVVGAHARDSLGSDLVEVVVDHVAECEGCDRVWGELPSPVDTLRRLPVVTPAPELRDRVWARVRRRYRWSGPGSSVRRIRTGVVAACLSLVLGTVALVYLGGGAAAETVEISASPNVEATRELPPPIITERIAPTPKPTSTTVAVEAAPVPTAPTSTTGPPSEPPVVRIITPVNGQQVAASSGLTFVKLVAVVQDDVDEGLVVSWHNGTIHLASGNSVTVTLPAGCPEPRTYTITATATDSSGGRSSETVVFNLLCDDPDQ